jgi:3-dehydroquinate dehydratase
VVEQRLRVLEGEVGVPPSATVAAAVVNVGPEVGLVIVTVGGEIQGVLPGLEVHISNPARRGTASDIATAARGTVTGFGIVGYELAMRGLKALVSG